MTKTTQIQWCDTTCNPTMGCEGCELWTAKVRTCYAGIQHVRWKGGNRGFSPTFEVITRFPGRMKKASRWSDLTGTIRTDPDKPWLNGLPRLIFVSDMSDSLSAVVPFEYLEQEVIRNVTSSPGQRHRWLWLTKRPDRMAKFSSWLEEKSIQWPENLWAGTSVTTQVTTSRVKHLLRVGDASTIRFLSVEPQHERIDLSAWLPRLNWVIQGGESGNGAVPFDLAWAYDLMRQCREARVAYFLKQLGAKPMHRGTPLSFKDGHAGDWEEWPKALRVRQFPIRPARLPKVRSVVTTSRSPSPGMKKSAAELSAIAHKAVATRRANELKRKASAAASNVTPKSLSPAPKKSAAELSAIALKAVATRRANELKRKASAAVPEAPPKPLSPATKKSAAELSAIALKAVATRRANELKRKRSAAALKAWETRRDKRL